MLVSELPGFGFVTAGVRTTAVRSVESTVGHLDFVHTIDVQFRVNDFLRRIDDCTMAFAAFHEFVGDMFSVPTRHASAAGGVTRGAGLGAWRRPRHGTVAAATIAVTITGAARRGGSVVGT